MDHRDDEANITLGRQGWADRPAAQLLGAGTSNSPAFSEVGLSANPAAMQHGLEVVQPSAPAAEPPAGPVAHAHAQRPGELSPAGPLRSTMHQPVTSTTPAALNAQTVIKAAPVPVAATAAAAPHVHFQSSSSSMEHSVSGAIQQQRQRMAPVLAQKARLAEEQQQQPGASAAGAGGGAGSGEQGPTPVGTLTVVQPSASQVGKNNAQRLCKAGGKGVRCWGGVGWQDGECRGEGDGGCRREVGWRESGCMVGTGWVGVGGGCTGGVGGTWAANAQVCRGGRHRASDAWARLGLCPGSSGVGT